MNLRVGSILYTAKLYCVIGDMDDVVKLRVGFSVRSRIAASQLEAGDRELVPITTIAHPCAGITSEGKGASETTRKRGLFEMIDNHAQKRQRWESKWSE